MSFIRWGITIVGCAAVFGALATWKVRDIQAAIAAGEAYPEQSETVEPATVAVAQYVPTITVMGEIVAPQRLDLRNEIAGEITKVNFESGAEVRKGQLLLQLDIAVEAANLEAAKARAEVARLVHERLAKLFETRVATEDQLDKAKADFASAQAEISVLERTIEKKTLRSPFDGRAGLHNFEVGQYLSSNSLITSLVGATDHMWVDFQMPQFYPQLPTGTAVNVMAIANNDSAQQPVSASIIAENTVLNANNRSRSYRGSIANGSQYYAPYTVVQLEVPVANAEPLLQVPALSVQNDPLGQYVFVLKPDGNGFRAARQQVRVRLLEGNRALIENGTGLAAGDRIAGAGAFKLYEGILVFTGERVNSNGNEGAGSASDGGTL